MPKLVCDVEGCDNEISEGTGSKGGLPICSRCRAAQYSTAKLNKDALKEKRARWSYWESRLDYLEPRILRMMADAEKRVTGAKRSATK
jgi:hypothetical protein